MDDSSLGRLERVDLGDAWEAEDRDFTPWLARPENLAVLAEALGLELETEAQEKPVGLFRADILCKETESDAWVVIENQLQRTDHTHLGQLLTYAAGLEAVTIIWIAKSFRDEHRSALDWLNGVTDEKVRFFALEVELWRIGESLPAPKFNVVSKPNDWSRSIARAAADPESSETKIKRIKYWTAFNKVLDDANGPVEVMREPQNKTWMPHDIGCPNFRLFAAMVPQKECVRAGIPIRGKHAEAFFGLLKQQKDDIEQDLGYSLEWEELRKNYRIACYCEDGNPSDESDWSRQHKWLTDHLNNLHRVFSDRIRNLNIKDWEGDD